MLLAVVVVDDVFLLIPYAVVVSVAAVIGIVDGIFLMISAVIEVVVAVVVAVVGTVKTRMTLRTALLSTLRIMSTGTATSRQNAFASNVTTR